MGTVLFDMATEFQEQGFFTEKDFKDILKAHGKAMTTLDANAKALGYRDADALQKSRWMRVGGAGAAGVGLSGMVATAAGSATLGGWWAGTGTLAVSAGVGLGGGAVLAIAGVIVFALASIRTNKLATEDEYSTQIKEMFEQTFVALG